MGLKLALGEFFTPSFVEGTAYRCSVTRVIAGCPVNIRFVVGMAKKMMIILEAIVKGGDERIGKFHSS